MDRQRWSPRERANAAMQHVFSAQNTPGSRDLRVGDADRQRVVAELQRHYVEGRLNSDELAERVDTALAARTESDLAALLEDLPGPPQPEPAPRHAPNEWWTPFTTAPGLLLAVLIGLVVLTWLVALPEAHMRGAPILSFLFLGFFFFRPPRSRR